MDPPSRRYGVSTPHSRPPGSGPEAATHTRHQLRHAVRTGTRAALVTVVLSTTLALVKITAGLVGHAYALVADGVESITDVFTSLVVLGGLRWSVRPTSEEFPYGLGKAESLAAVAVSTLILAAGVGIAVQAVREIRSPQQPPEAWTLLVLAAVVLLKEVMFRFVRRRARETGSGLLGADAWHHRSDALTSAAAFVGVSVALVAGPGFESADEWAALVACAVILWNGGRLLRQAIRETLDAAAPTAVSDRVASLAAGVSEVRDVEQVRVRRSGMALLVDIHIEVDPDLSVDHGHEIAHRVKTRLVESDLPVLDALVHVEPWHPGAGARSGGTPPDPGAGDGPTVVDPGRGTPAL